MYDILNSQISRIANLSLYAILFPIMLYPIIEALHRIEAEGASKPADANLNCKHHVLLVPVKEYFHDEDTLRW